MSEILGNRANGRVAEFTAAVAMALLAGAALGSCGDGRGTLSDSGVGGRGQADSSTGISKDRAIDMARAFVQKDATVISARSGRFGDVYEDPNMGPITDQLASREVWVVAFESQFTICPPDGSACWPPRPGFITVVLDQATGDWISQSAYSPQG
jgi:hypothetical protein